MIEDVFQDCPYIGQNRINY